MLTEINEVGFKRFNEEPMTERSRCFMSYDFHIVNGEDCYLVNHKITPFALAPDGRAWLAMCVVSLSHHTTPGHVEFRKKGQSIYWEYDLNSHRWQERKSITLRGQEKQVLILSAQGYTVSQEKQVLILSAQGYTVPQIADRMCRAVDTVKTYKRALFERLGVRSITEALTVAANQGLL